ncbi:ATP-binding cassette domain-containing protein [Clostridioides difficile]|nr:ATP-binding cassette domain-containing protein [Clostridioides difficile]
MLRIKNVNLCVGSNTLLHNINLSLEQGKIYGLLGANGAGKTTLFKSMLGLTAYTGEILSDEKPAKSSEFGSLIEYPAFYPKLSVMENLKLHASYIGLTNPDLENSLKQVNLWDARNKLFSQLSLGMRQRLGIARAFLGNAKYLLLDEPTNGLDPMGIKEIRILLRDKLKTPKHCIIVSSHNLTEIAAITDILIFIRNGQIIEMVENKYDEKELEVLYENLMTSINTEEVQ